MREAPEAADLCWRELAIVTKALAGGRDVTEVGLMRGIALRTSRCSGTVGGCEGAADAFCTAYFAELEDMRLR